MNIKTASLDSLIVLFGTSTGNPELHQEIRRELLKRVPDNNRFSREYFFELCHIKNKGIVVHFIPGTESFERYGESILLDVVFKRDEIVELYNNLTSEPPFLTYGVLTAKPVLIWEASEEIIRELATEGFNTCEVATISGYQI